MGYLKNPYLKERVFLSIDLETIPDGTPPVVDRDAIAEMIKCPDNYKKQETIDAWNATKKPVLVDEAVAAHQETFAKRGLSGSTGKIISIALVHDGGEQVFTGADEAELLQLAFEYIGTLGEPITFVGHFLVQFDLNFLRQRAIVHQRKAPLSLRKAWTAKPWDTETIGDTATLWDRDKRIKLHDLCLLLGAESPKADGIDGSQVWPLWQAGELGKISSYNLADARAALECYRRIQAVV